MIVRQLGQEEILPALHLIWEVFAEDTAPGYTPQGVVEFQKFIKYENIMQYVSKRDMVFFGAFEAGELLGASAVRTTGHICLFFVKKKYQRKGIGRMLFHAMCQHCTQVLAVTRITVNAAPGSVEIYSHLGMRVKAPEEVKDGIRFVPMEMEVFPGAVSSPPPKKKNVWLIAAVAAGCLVTLFLIAVFFVNVAREAAKDIRTEQYSDEYGGYGDGNGGRYPDYNEEDEWDTEELTGMEAIPEYVEENLNYEAVKDSYTYQSEDTKRTSIQFEVYFPKLSGLEEKVQDKINQSLKDCAMESVDRLYLNPSAETKEEVLGQEYPVLASFVDYKISYMSEDFLSVVFQDYNYRIDGNSYQVTLRTRNISLKDGAVYEVKDIVKLNDEFIDEWIDVMRSEAGGDPILSELGREDLKAVLSGEDKGGIYLDNFFVDAEGLEIGLSLEYPEGDENDAGYGWVTAPFEVSSLKDYKTDSSFWNYIKE